MSSSTAIVDMVMVDSLIRRGSGRPSSLILCLDMPLGLVFEYWDVGCAKGFMLYDFKRLVPGIEVAGVDISDYAIVNAKPEVSEFLDVANATSLPYEDNSFDLVISINTIHNLDKADCERALREISRVSKGGAFITVDAFNTEEERDRMYAWNLTAKTIMSTDDWKLFFKQCDYKGDYFWFILRNRSSSLDL